MSCLPQRARGRPAVQALQSSEDADELCPCFLWSSFCGSSPVIWGGQQGGQEQVVLTVLFSLAPFFCSAQTCSPLPTHLHFPLKLQKVLDPS